jgi:putative nucleotidyltransferase with HDIG domain
MQGVDRREGVGHKDNFFHTLKVVDNIVSMTDDLWLRWAALLHDIGKPRTKRFRQGGWTFHGHEDVGARMVPKIFKKLKLPQNEKMRYVQKLVRLHQRPIALAGGEVTDSAIRRLVVEAGEDLEDLLTLCRADITTRDPKREARYLKNYDALEARIRHVLERDELRNWQPPVSGEDIMAEFDLKPSKAVGEIKAAIREAILEGEIPNDRGAAINHMRRVGPEIIAGTRASKNTFS